MTYFRTELIRTSRLLLISVLLLTGSLGSRAQPLGSAAVPLVRINELMASNVSGIRDEDGDYSDWIELFNAGTNSVDLGGCFLTDNPSRLGKWRFPSVIVPPQTYLVVWASGKNRTNGLAPLHTNFKLSASGEFLALVQSDGATVVSAFSPGYPQQYDDVSYGSDPSNPSYTGFLTEPTPGSANGQPGAGFAPPVEFSSRSGTFQSAFSLTLSTLDPDAIIRYYLVTNRATAARTNFPDSTSYIYTNPIPVSLSMEVRARAFPSQPSYFPGPPASETFLQITPGAANFSSDLPIVVLCNFVAGAVPASIYQPGVIMVFGTNAGPSSMTNAPDLVSRMGFHRHGSSTLDDPQSNFEVALWGESNLGTKREVLGLPADEDWILYAPDVFDPVLIHNPFMYQLSREAGRYASRTRFAEVFLANRTGAINFINPAGANYNGVYVLEEKIKRGSSRVDVARLEPENKTLPTVSGGYLFKIDRFDYPYEAFNTTHGQTVVHVYPSGEELHLAERKPQLDYVHNYFNSFETVLYGANYRDPTNGYAAWIDADSWIDYHILNTLSFNVDAMVLSAFFYKDRQGRITMGPLWDFDRSLGCSGGGDFRAFNPRVWRGIQGDDYFASIGWWARLFHDPDFWQKWIDRWQDLRQGEFSTNHLLAVVDELGAYVRNAQVREVAHWRGNGQSDTKPRNGRISSNGYTYTFNGTYQGELDFMKHWLADRVDFVDTNFLSAPVLDTTTRTVAFGSQVTITSGTIESNTVVCYTVDGTDPRKPGGDLSSSAAFGVNSVTITLTNSVTLIARNFNSSHHNTTSPQRAGSPPLSTPWSGPSRAWFGVVNQPRIKSISLANEGRALLSFQAEPNLLYSIQCADNPGGTWSLLADLPPGLTNRTIQFTDWEAPSGSRIYRLVVQAP